MKIRKKFSILVLLFLVTLIYYLTSNSLVFALDNNVGEPQYMGIQLNGVQQDRKQNQETLKDFLKNTEKIDAKYTYPSMPPQQNLTPKVILPAHTPVTLRNLYNISTDNIVSGTSVDFAVLADVKDGSGNTIIKAGTPATAQIIFAKQTGDNLGKAGKLEVSDFHTRTVDGRYVPLSGTISSQGEDRMVLSIVLSVLVCPLFLLMDGDSAVIPTGATKTAYTVSDLYSNY